MKPIDRVGTFQADIIEYGLQKYESGAVAVAVKCLIRSQWNPESQLWDDWSGYEQHEAGGFLNVVKKDGTLNSNQVEALVQHAGWDGQLSSIANEQWRPTPCQIKVDPNEYKGKTTFQISFINQFDRIPGAVGNVNIDEAKSMDAQHGGALRALLANARRNGTRPAKPVGPRRRRQWPKQITDRQTAIHLSQQMKNCKRHNRWRYTVLVIADAKVWRDVERIPIPIGL